jgi:5-methylcytosine-specific restriction endonuclease McrA
MSPPRITPEDKARTKAKRAKLDNIGRSLPEWIGATPDAQVPLAVKLRVLRRYKNRCYLSGQLIRGGDEWDVEHVLALGLHGQNRESNLAPALKEPHREKTASDVGAMAKADRVARKHFGLEKPKKGFRGWRNFRGEIVLRGERDG